MNKITSKQQFKSFKITADDYGYCPERNKGILEAVEEGVVNSISVLVNAFAVAPIHTSNDVQIGMHLNLTEGTPVSQCDAVTSLLDNTGHFYDKLSIEEQIREGRILRHNIDIEIESQIKKFIEIFSSPPYYVDGHQHVHVLPVVRDSLIKMMQKYHIEETRLPKELNISACNWIEEQRLGFYLKVYRNASEAKKCFDSHNITSPTYFIGLSTMSKDMNAKNLTKALEIILQDMKKNPAPKQARFVELMTHPGYESKNGIGGCSERGPDRFSCSLDRNDELDFLKSKKFSEILLEFEFNVQQFYS